MNIVTVAKKGQKQQQDVDEMKKKQMSDIQYTMQKIYMKK